MLTKYWQEMSKADISIKGAPPEKQFKQISWEKSHKGYLGLKKTYKIVIYDIKYIISMCYY